MKKWTVQAVEGVKAGAEAALVEMGGEGVVRMGGSLLGGLRAESAEWEPAVVWTGSMAELEGGGLFEAHPRTWGQAGWTALEEACRGVGERGAGRIVIRPHARHVVSDVPGIRRFGTTIAAALPGRFGLMLDPVSMLDVTHFEHHAAEDTLRRLAGAIEELDTPELPLVGVVVANVRREGDRQWASPIDQGLIDPGLLRGLFAGG